jgi:hypothetical protein
MDVENRSSGSAAVDEHRGQRRAHRESVACLDVDLGEVAHRDVGKVAGAVAGAVGRDREGRIGAEGEGDVVAVSCTSGGPRCLGIATQLPAASGARAGSSAALGRGHYAVPAGKSRRIRVRLTARGRRALRGHRTLRARLQLRSRAGASTSMTTVTLRRSR